MMLRPFLTRLMVDWLRWWRGPCLRTMGYGFAILSGMIVLGQLTMFSGVGSLSPLLLLWGACLVAGSFLATLVLLMPPLMYMALTTSWGLQRLKIRGLFGLYSNHLTDASSLLWYVYILLKLSPALCYHFLLLVRVHGTAFQDFLGQMNVVPLGSALNTFFSCLITCLVFFNGTGLYHRVIECLSDYVDVSALEFVEGSAYANIDVLVSGQRLIEEELRKAASLEAAAEVSSSGDFGGEVEMAELSRQTGDSGSCSPLREGGGGGLGFGRSPEVEAAAAEEGQG
eukprot:TRINITY_DN34592_c0_g1_i1.p1 TRINITY_DN34592_c0_g1~~TRINITY_DN34592_c0_g1_i1.p1  ORF type:complete len:284 (-),score=82.04 TRINITY_DN34592_c0_g1_i1:565-1416(-)